MKIYDILKESEDTKENTNVHDILETIIFYSVSSDSFNISLIFIINSL